VHQRLHVQHVVLPRLEGVERTSVVEHGHDGHSF
jgi:hypothetical protein